MLRLLSLRAPGLLFVLLVSYFQFRSWVVVHDDNMPDLIKASYGVVYGTPHWRAFQNRVFAPYLIEALGWVSSEPFLLFMKASLATLNVALYGLVWRLTRSEGRAILAVLGAVLAWSFQQHFWCYTWDMVEAVCLLFLVYFAMVGQFNAWVALLIAVSIFNKETAACIGVFFVARGLVEPLAGRPVNKKMVASGVALAVLSMVVAEALRHWLFKSSSLDGVGADLVHVDFGNHWKGADNLQLIVDALRKPSTFLFLMLFYVTAMVALVVDAFETRQLNMIGLSMALISYAVALMLWGLFNEYRIFQPLMWCMFLLLACAGRRAASSATALPAG